MLFRGHEKVTLTVELHAPIEEARALRVGRLPGKRSKFCLCGGRQNWPVAYRFTTSICRGSMNSVTDRTRVCRRKSGGFQALFARTWKDVGVVRGLNAPAGEQVRTAAVILPANSMSSRLAAFPPAHGPRQISERTAADAGLGSTAQAGCVSSG